MSTPKTRRQRLLIGQVSDPGKIRPNNEDLVFADPDRGIFLVVDGVGGQVGGEVAAEIAVEAISGALSGRNEDPAEQVEKAILEANNAIYEEAQRDPKLKGMSCVLTLAVVEGRMAVVGHVGDTRLYRIRAGRMEKLTLDHSPVGEREDRHEISEREAMAHPRRNEVFRDVGSQRRDSAAGWADVFLTTFPPDAAFLLCSDGLSDQVPQAEMMRIIGQFQQNPQPIAEKLASAANAAGGKDNVSVLFVPGPDFSLPKRAATGDGAITRPLDSDGHHPSHTRRNGHTVRDSMISVAPAARSRSAWPLVLLALLLGLAAGAAGLWFAQDQATAPPAIRRAGRVIAIEEGGSLVEALAEANPGDVIRAGSGRYPGPIALKSGVRLEAVPPGRAQIFLNQPGPDALVSADKVASASIAGFDLSADPIRPAPVILRVADSEVSATGLTIRGAPAAGIEVRGASKLTLTGSLLRSHPGPAVLLTGAAQAWIRRNRFESNGAGIRIKDQADAVVEDNVFRNQPNPIQGSLATVEGFKDRNLIIEEVPAKRPLPPTRRRSVP